MADAGKGGAFETRAIHVGQPSDPITGAVCVPISLATTFAQRSPGEHTGFEYSRTGNPTRAALEQCFASLEGAKHALAYASGSAATCTVLHLLSAGDHVLTIDDVYGGTNRYFRRVAAPFAHIEFTFADLSKPGELEKHLNPKTKLLWLESPTNPTLKISDIKALAAAAHERNIIVVVDNTFASPYFQQPLALGADIVVHSVTKYINGHSDVVMGIVATNDSEIHDKLKFLQNCTSF
jgi:cystathionine gamma-lyase